jgi:hypothetical protein
MVWGALAAILTVASPDEAFDAPPAGRSPGIGAMWIGGTVLTLATAVNTNVLTCPNCQPVAPDQLLQSGIVFGAGVFLSLMGMMWLAWVQPAEEPVPKSPGISAIASGLVESGLGVLQTVTSAPNVPEPFRTENMRSCGVIIGAGLALAAAGLAWIIWASR